MTTHPPVEMTWALFLGGSLDGHRLPVPSDHTTYETARTDTYREEQFTQGETSRMRLFVHTSFTPAKALAVLIAGYERPR